MHKLLLPNEIRISEIKENKSLSPNNYKKLSIKNQSCSKVSYYLNDDKPYYKGIEPGSSSYVPNSSQIFLRNSCINNIQFSVDKTKYIYLNPKYYCESTVFDGDVLFCTDANIGDCSLFIGDNESMNFSSGIVKLNFKEDKFKYYVMAFMRDDYFREQLNAKTPKGATIKHSGDLFLDCLIPDSSYEWVYSLIESLIKNITYSEYYSDKKLRLTEQLIDEELMSMNVDYSNPSIKELKYKKRLDSGIYSEKVFCWRENTKCYKNGYSNLEEYGFELKRGPNLAKRDLGRSIQTEEYHQGYSVLIYPSDISSSGYINKVSYLGAKNPIWFLGEKDILFAAEGTVGKTFVVCDNTMHFTTNFHGTIIRPKISEISLSKSIYLGLYLNFLRYKGIFECMSVGANGGSFAVGYWNNILIPNVDEDFMDKLAEIYNNNSKLNPAVYNEKMILNTGIYQLNSFIIKCKALLTQLCNDIKNNELKTEEYYKHMVD